MGWISVFQQCSCSRHLVVGVNEGISIGWSPIPDQTLGTLLQLVTDFVTEVDFDTLQAEIGNVFIIQIAFYGNRRVKVLHDK